MKLMPLISMKTLVLVACLCVTVQSRGLRDGDDQGNGLPSISEDTVAVAQETEHKDLIHDHTNHGNRRLSHSDGFCHSLEVRCGPTKTCASIGFPGMCCSRWGVSTLFMDVVFTIFL